MVENELWLLKQNLYKDTPSFGKDCFDPWRGLVKTELAIYKDFNLMDSLGSEDLISNSYAGLGRYGMDRFI